MSWNTLAYYSEAKRWQLEPMAPRFYDGLCGVAVFLAAAQKLAGEPELRALARSALATIVHEALPPDYVRLLLLGIGAGLGNLLSSIRLCVRVSFWGKRNGSTMPDFCRKLDAERIASDRSFDLLSGAAGAILALLALYEATRLPEALDQATLCGEHLLQHRSDAGKG